MNKIIRIALQNKFPGIEIEALMEVINQTPNAVIAVETLMNVYEVPDISKTSIYPQGSSKICRFKSFDKYTEKVTYEYDSTESKTLYFDTKEIAEESNSYDLAVSNKTGRDYYSRDDFRAEKSFRIPCVSKLTCDLESWNGCK